MGAYLCLPRLVVAAAPKMSRCHRLPIVAMHAVVYVDGHDARCNPQPCSIANEFDSTIILEHGHIKYDHIIIWSPKEDNTTI